MKGNLGQGLFLKSNCDLQLYAYCEVDWGACPLTRCSLAGYFVTLGRSLISWKTKKQATVSIAEAEYRAMAIVTSELIWLKSLLSSFGIFVTHQSNYFVTIRLLYILPRILFFHERTKHIEIHCHFV